MEALRDVIIPVVAILGVMGLTCALVRFTLRETLGRYDRMLVLLEQLVSAMHELTCAVRKERRLE